MIDQLAATGLTFDIVPHLGALVAAYLLALPIGWDREKGERSAGLRTFPLVAIASCGFIQATETLTAGSPEATARIVEGLITGMGFIGGGAILVVKASVRGTATAASLWATGAIGTSVGLGAYDVAIVLAIMTFLTLRLNANLKSDGPQNRPD
ncbi:putative Mg2+ transporter-C (MgtC) family protein [Neorhizobium sp. R1-B]|uniref:MgtC/SapB family protein n=1 Tax=Neorhizobium TaxID=1525371 RepID=UPI000CF9BA18|nr:MULTISPECIES: MgtC/SapB family protein [Neorhizobium]TCV57763.1 putative Mg2+ transporter-C (MgtC) family protein [Neorhizobium sp. S3-V5DH]TDX82260.1 putative Mg2+ transporter-C (MgtC) family protein [Neorhizobium sp. R1-B]